MHLKLMCEKANRSRAQWASVGDSLPPVHRKLLQDIFGVRGIRYAPADEVAQAGPLFGDDSDIWRFCPVIEVVLAIIHPFGWALPVCRAVPIRSQRRSPVNRNVAGSPSDTETIVGRNLARSCPDAASVLPPGSYRLIRQEVLGNREGAGDRAHVCRAKNREFYVLYVSGSSSRT